LVEGNLDVIASHQAGIRQVVATAGTALTEPLLKSLSRFTGDIRLCFDSDRAGVAATERAIPIASKTKVTLSIISLPTGKDPDELIKKDSKTWSKIVEKNEYVVDWLLALYESRLDLSTATGKKEFSDVLMPVIENLSDPVERDHYLTKISTQLNVSTDSLQR
jgi:DNA primase